MDRDRSAWVSAELERSLGARYEILNLHGQGGMGMVFCARERALERLVAIKVLAPGAGMNSDARARFQSEARTAAALSHPSIVPVFELGETQEFPYIVMEFVRGESLGRRLRHEGRLSPDVTRRILLDLADALDHAHRRGIIHRDLKPENVLLAAESGRARLADFGIAKALDDGRHLTQTGVAIGTPEYMSPEQAASERTIDHRSDLYSLGAIGYTMLAGRPPHQGESAASIMTKHVLEEPVALRDLAPGAPQDLVAAITRCLEKRPDNRWPDARALQVALAREAGEDEPVGEELRGITGFGAFMGLVLLAALAWAVHGWNDPFVMVIAPLAAVLVTAGFLNYARGIAANGYALNDVLRVSMWPPKWWGLWWPRRLRRPSDVWDCLPTSGRLTRGFLTFMFASIVAYLVMRSSLSLGTRELIDRGILLLVSLGVVIIAIGLLRWTRIGFALKDASRLLFGPTVGATFWNQTQVSAVLITRPDAAPACAVPPPETVRAMLHAIEDTAARLSGSARVTGSGAADVARTLVDRIERLDAEIESLARNADPEELANVERRLTQLQEGQRDAREHLDKYATWMRAQADLLEVKRLDREDANGTLRAIWTVLERLREHSGRGTPQEAELLEQLRALANAGGARGAQGA